MKATDFESRHPLLLHQAVVSAAFLTYLLDRDDVVWRFIKGSGNDVRASERALFAVATILFGLAAWVCTVARRRGVSPRVGYSGELLYAIALGSLAPLAGFLILVAAEGIRLGRLTLRDDILRHEQVAQGTISWAESLRLEAVKWGIFLSMIVFTVTLIDRVAEVLIAVSALLWIILNARSLIRGKAQ